MGTKNNRIFGFTLIELLVVISIIIFLLLLAFILFRSQIFKANDAKRKGDIERIQVAVEEYEKDNNCYPLPQLVTCDPGSGLNPYLGKIPCDPTTDASYYYDYEDSACPSWYRIFATLENSQDTDILPYCGPGNSFNYYISSPNAPNCIITGPLGNFYGCKLGRCVEISWDPSRPGPECDPNYQSSNCYGQCGSPVTECKPWNE